MKNNTTNPHSELGEFGGHSAGAVLAILGMNFFVVLVPVGEENVAAVLGDFPANRPADSGASADACR